MKLMKILSISSVFPSKRMPFSGLFVYERMRHVSQRAEVTVISPVPWSPFDRLARLFRKNFRNGRKGFETRGGMAVRYVPFFCLPGIFKFMDGFFYYLGIKRPANTIFKKDKPDIIDVHFAYPDGFGVMMAAGGLGIPFCVTLRGTEMPYSRSFYRRWQMKLVFKKAAKIISVSRSLAGIAINLGAEPEKVKVIPNGVDTSLFAPKNKDEARKNFDIPKNAKVILCVGGLVKRKGFHRVIKHLQKLQKIFPCLMFLIVGGESAEGDYSEKLKAQVKELRLESVVRFEGQQSPEKLPWYYSAADLFVLATANEGWPNVIVESLACGTPVVATDVGGIKEIMSHDYLGYTVPFGDSQALYAKMEKALTQSWDHEKITAHAQQRSWTNVADEVLATFTQVLKEV